jgi:hypothetical protein
MQCLQTKTTRPKHPTNSKNNGVKKEDENVLVSLSQQQQQQQQQVFVHTPQAMHWARFFMYLYHGT